MKCIKKALDIFLMIIKKVLDIFLMIIVILIGYIMISCLGWILYFSYVKEPDSISVINTHKLPYDVKEKVYDIYGNLIVDGFAIHGGPPRGAIGIDGSLVSVESSDILAPRKFIIENKGNRVKINLCKEQVFLVYHDTLYYHVGEPSRRHSPYIVDPDTMHFCVVPMKRN